MRLSRTRLDKLKNVYHITPERFQAIWIAQDGRCAICGRFILSDGVLSDNDKNVAQPDHDHDTGDFRAFLCKNCNVGLGHFCHNSDILEKAAAYLQYHKKKV